jgi:hypothetical protein
MAITKDIVADYSCPTDGTSDCRAAFLAFKADAQGETATLNIPAGTYTFASHAGPVENTYIFNGIPDLTVNMAGVTFVQDFFALGARTVLATAGTFARVDTVIAGSIQARCKTFADATIFSVGEYLLLSGFDLQGLWTSSYGFPPNPHYFEWLKVASVNGTTGIVTFESAATQTYKDTWPAYGQGALPDQGGPATLSRMGSSWDCSHKFNGGEIAAPAQAINCAGREMIFTGYTQNGFCINPSQNLTMRFIDSTIGSVEVDKLVGTYSFEGTTTAGTVSVQSSSVDLLQLKDTASITTLNGTPKRVRAYPGTTIGTLSVGCVYGRTDEVYFDTMTINAVVLPSGVPFKGPGEGGVELYDMTDGVITIPNTDNAMPWAIPGTWCYWQGQYATETGFRVLDITQDATNIYVTTSMTGSWPSVPKTSGKLWLRPQPAPRATFINCIGCAEVVDWSQFGTVPYASRSRRTYTKSIAATTASIYNPGAVTSITYDVTAAFAGTQNPLTFRGGGPFNNNKTLGPPTSYTAADYGPIVNLRTTGTRTITAGGVTGTQAGDSNLALPNANTWLTGTISQSTSNDVSADPSNFSITVEIIADHGITYPTAAVPLRFRTRAP